MSWDRRAATARGMRPEDDGNTSRPDDWLPQRALLDILTRTAYLLGWHRHFGPASGSDPKIRNAMARYVLTAFAHGKLLGPSQVAAHIAALNARPVRQTPSASRAPQSPQALDLLGKEFPQASVDGATARMVFEAPTGRR